MKDERDVLEIAARMNEPVERAPSTLMSRVYSALMLEQAADGPLLGLSECQNAGRELCVFETLVHIAPFARPAESLNYCRVCHARVLGERIEAAPIWWAGCPYAQFQNRD